MAIETPAYEVLRHDGPFEFRRYEGYLRASVRVAAGSHGEAASDGFNALADYIFGNNRSSDRIAMTAPVTAGRDSGERIAMTVPVTAARSQDEYVVSFTMPSEYSMETLPRPNNPAVSLEAVGSHFAASVRYSGYATAEAIAEAKAGLEAWMREQNLTPAGEMVVAQYDAPWKPSFARHNEVLIPVEAAKEDLH